MIHGFAKNSKPVKRFLLIIINVHINIINTLLYINKTIDYKYIILIILRYNTLFIFILIYSNV